MSIRLHELHPSLVHYPLALVPLALGLDALGCLLGKRSWSKAGGRIMPLAAAAGAVTAGAGLIAQSAVRIPPQARKTLVTHRNLNLGIVALTAALSVVRTRTERPGLGYFAAGFAGLVAMKYTAYLGGHLVYRHGVGVEAAGGVREERSPEVRWENIRDVLGTTAERDARAAVARAHPQ